MEWYAFVGIFALCIWAYVGTQNIHKKEVEEYQREINELHRELARLKG